MWAESSDGDRPAAKVVRVPRYDRDRVQNPASSGPGGASTDGRDGKGSTIAVGPEGGFSGEEVNRRASGWRVASLGQRVLRVETAAIAAAAALVEARTFAFSVVLPGQTVERLP